MLSDKFLIVRGGFSRQDVGRLTGVGWADEGDFDGDHVLCCYQDKPEVVVLEPYMGTLG